MRDHPSTVGQIPPDSGNPVELTFRLPGTDYVRVIATAQDQALPPIYALDTEYWAYAGVPSTFAANMTMVYGTGNYSQSDVRDFLSGYTVAFAVGETVSQGAWTSWSQSPYSPPTGMDTYLYSAPDPDGGGNQIGLLLVVHRAILWGVVWYNIGAPSGGWIWQPGQGPTSGLTWTYVGTSPDPNTIASSSSWYYIPQN